MRLCSVAFASVLVVAALAGCSAMRALADNEDRVPEGELTEAPEGEGWLALFDEAHAGGWQNVTDDEEGLFTIEDGVFHITGQSPTRYIAFTPQTFGDFELHIEFKLTEEANSGVFIRSAADNPVYAGMEIQVFENHGEPPSNHGCGALYDIATPMFNMVKPAGEWNSFDMTVQGSELKVRCNGWLVLHVDLAKMTMPIGKFDTPLAELPQDGHIILQDHGHEVWYRNLMVRPL